MRVISQDGTIDMPYEMVVVKRFGNAVYFLNRNLAGVENQVRDIELAKYSTEEKAKKAMEKMRDVYEFYAVKATPDGNGLCSIPTAVFQFPAEEELE